MHWFFRVLLCAFVASLLACGADFQVGAAQVKINPAPGTPLAGYYSLRPSDGVLDDLHAKALVFEAGGEKAAIVITDLSSLPRHVVVKARELIAQQSGVAASHVLLAATHTHTAPVVARETSRDDFDGRAATSAARTRSNCPRCWRRVSPKQTLPCDLCACGRRRAALKTSPSIGVFG
jgi:hypothetical protein